MKITLKIILHSFIKQNAYDNKSKYPNKILKIRKGNKYASTVEQEKKSIFSKAMHKMS